MLPSIDKVAHQTVPGRSDGQAHGDVGDGARIDDVGVLVAPTSATVLRSQFLLFLLGKSTKNMGNDGT